MTRDGRGAGDEVAGTKDPLPVKFLVVKATSSHPHSYFVVRLSVTYRIA